MLRWYLAALAAGTVACGEEVSLGDVGSDPAAEEAAQPELDPTRPVPEAYRDVAYTLNFESAFWYEGPDGATLARGPTSVAIAVEGWIPLSFRAWCVGVGSPID